MDPLTMVLLTQGVGMGVNAIGQGISGGNEREMLLKQLAMQERGLDESEKMGAFNRGMATRNQNATGIAMLAQQRERAMDRYKNDMFKKDLYRLVG